MILFYDFSCFIFLQTGQLLSDQKKNKKRVLLHAKKKLNEVEGRSLTPHTHTVQQKRVVRVTTDWSRTNIYRLTIIDVVEALRTCFNYYSQFYYDSFERTFLSEQSLCITICRKIKVLLRFFTRVYTGQSSLDFSSDESTTLLSFNFRTCCKVMLEINTYN